ncbi:MAG TPA: anti-sigma factor [Labilithrix sp.]|nr:anti-sigma factor [Labilithrix sp.]
MTAARDRLLELLADRATVGLGNREQIELAELLVQAQDVDIAAFDKAAAAVAIAGISARLEPMPAALAASIEERALAAMAASHRPAPASDHTKTRELEGRPMARTVPLAAPPAQPSSRPILAAPASAAPGPVPSVAPQPSSFAPPPSNVVALPVARKTNVVALLGWVAAAACLLLAIGAFATRKPGPAPVATVTPVPTPPPSAEGPAPAPGAPESAAQLRDKLLAVAGTVRAEWAATKDPGGRSAGGEVVWNKDQQRGTMTFRGLARNDPSRTQYQLWIFDKARDDKYPVDGGVFDVDAESGDVVVPIRAALPVSTPTLFAITIEKPGGVVVSKREHLVLTAKLPAG